MRKTIYIAQALMMSGVLLSQSAQAASPNAEALAYTCFACHGVNGNSKGPATPSLAGLDKKYIVESMQSFKSDVRPGTIMGRIARGYSDEEIELVAGFFAAQEKSAAVGNLSKEIAVITDMNESEKLSEAWNPQLHYALLDFLSIEQKAHSKSTTVIKIKSPLEVK